MRSSELQKYREDAEQQNKTIYFLMVRREEPALLTPDSVLFYQIIFTSEGVKQLQKTFVFNASYYLVEPCADLIDANKFASTFGKNFTKFSNNEICIDDMFLCKKVKIVDKIYGQIYTEYSQKQVFAEASKSSDTKFYELKKEFERIYQSNANFSASKLIDILEQMLHLHGGSISKDNWLFIDRLKHEPNDDLYDEYVSLLIYFVNAELEVDFLSNKTTLLKFILPILERKCKKTPDFKVAPELLQSFELSKRCFFYNEFKVDLPERICIYLKILKCNHETCIAEKTFVRFSDYSNSAIQTHIISQQLFQKCIGTPQIRKILSKGRDIDLDIDLDIESEFLYDQYLEQHKVILPDECLSFLDPMLVELASIDIRDAIQVRFGILEEQKKVTISGQSRNIIYQRVQTTGPKKTPKVTIGMAQIWYGLKNPFIELNRCNGRDLTDMDHYIFIKLYVEPLTIFELSIDIFKRYPQLFNVIYNTKPLKYLLQPVFSISEDVESPYNVFGLRPSDIIEGIREGYFLKQFNKVQIKENPKYEVDLSYAKSHFEYVSWEGPDLLAQGAPDYTNEIAPFLRKDIYNSTMIQTDARVSKLMKSLCRDHTGKTEEYGLCEREFEEFNLLQQRPRIIKDKIENYYTELKFLDVKQIAETIDFDEKSKEVPNIREMFEKRFPFLTDDQISYLIYMICNNFFILGCEIGSVYEIKRITFAFNFMQFLFIEFCNLIELQNIHLELPNKSSAKKWEEVSFRVSDYYHHCIRNENDLKGIIYN